jgi:valyl-tRNA synthetase
LWWGQRIPAWYDDAGNYVVAKTLEEAKTEFAKKGFNGTPRQDEDVVDTWFSSWLWPITVFDPAAIRNGKGNGNADLKYYYPTNDLVTAPEILFFWVARMIIAGYEYVGERPFSNVYLTGIVRDKQGRKMSKSLGNSPDPLGLIEKYGADGVRVGMLLCSPAGNDLPFDESMCEQGRNFWNKIWNASRLIRGFAVDTKLEQSASSKIASEWFDSRFNQQLADINEHFNKFRLSDALMATYKLVWDDFCSFYLEMIKPDFVDGVAKPIDAKTYEQASAFLENILKIVHPFMPFISEELYHLIGERKENDAVIVAKWPEAKSFDASVVAEFDLAQQVIATVRTFRSQKKLPPKEALELKALNVTDQRFFPTIQKLANISSIEVIKEAADNAFSFVAGQSQYFIPVGGNIDVEEERERLKKELEYNKGFLVSVQKKLANERFVQNAKPEVIDVEKKKMSDAEAKIKAIEAQLANL